jgi:hypothetical protein
MKQKKLSKKQLEQLTLDLKKHNKNMKEKRMFDLVISSLDDFILYRKGQLFKPIKSKSNSNYIPKASQVQTFNHKINSLTDSGSLSTIKDIPKSNEKLTYSGTYIKGIATMHKSNSIPVGQDDDPVNYSTMRRN